MLTSENLVGYLRAEFARASRLRVTLFFIQLAVAIPAAISVLVSDRHEVLLYWLALAGAGLLVIWWVLNNSYTKARSAAQSARRAALLLGGLGQSLSATEIQSLRERFTVTEAEAKRQENPDYYATKLTSGPARLAEMLEESALYSEQLQGVSATNTLYLLVVFVLCFLVIGFGITPYVERDTFYIVVRVFMAMLVFVMSADVLGAYRAHTNAAKEIHEIRQRLTNADPRGYPLSDVLLMFADYNAAVEAAPESVPWAYECSKERLNRQWSTYQVDRANARAQR